MAEQPDSGTQRYAQEQVNLGAEHYRQGRFAEAAAAWGVKTMWLATHETNRRAQQLYTRYGFKNAGKRSFKVGSATCRDVVMVASL